MRNRLIFAALGIVGVLLIGLAIASATVWRADEVLLATATADKPIVVTDPGVLDMAGDPVTVTATVPAGDHVVLAVGRDTDVNGWVGTDPHQRVTGLSGWHTLDLAEATAAPVPTGAATGTASPTASPAAAAPADATATVPDASSDMWLATVQGTGTATLKWSDQPGRWSLLVVGSTADGAAAPPTLSLEWPRTVTTPYLVPGAVLGGLLLLISLLYFWRQLRHPHGTEWTPVATGAIPVMTSEAGLTRRQMREMAEMARTGQLPTISRPAVPAPAVPMSDSPLPALPAVAGPTPWVPGPVGETTPAAKAAHDEAAAELGKGTAVTAAHDEAPSTRAGRRAARAAAQPPAADAATPADAAQGTVQKPTASQPPPDDDPATSADAAPAEAVAKGGGRAFWRRAAAPTEVTVAEPPATPAAAWAPAGAAVTDTDAPAAPAAAPAAPTAPVPAPAAPTAPVPVVGEPARPATPGGRRARRAAAAAVAAAEADQVSSGAAEGAAQPGRPAQTSSDTTPAGHPAADTPAAAEPAQPTSRPAWMRPAAPSPATPASPAPAPQHGPGGQPAWLSRVAARWEREDAADEAEDAAGRESAATEAPAPSSSTDAAPPAPPPHQEDEAQQEPSRADAWRRAWGLPPLDTEEEDR